MWQDVHRVLIQADIDDQVTTTLRFNGADYPAFIEKKSGPVANVLVSFADPDICERVTYAQAKQILLHDVFQSTASKIGEGMFNEVWLSDLLPSSVIRFSRMPLVDAYDARHEGNVQAALHSILPQLVPNVTGMIRVQYRNFDNNRFELVALLIERLYSCDDWQTCPLFASSFTSSLSERANNMVMKVFETAVDVVNNGLYHGDMNMGNIVFTKSGTKLIDHEHSCLTEKRGPSAITELYPYLACDEQGMASEYNRTHGFMAVEIVLRHLSPQLFQDSQFEVPEGAVDAMFRLYEPAARHFYPTLFSHSSSIQQRIEEMYMRAVHETEQSISGSCNLQDINKTCFAQSQLFVFAMIAFGLLTNLTHGAEKLHLENLALLQSNVHRLMRACLHPLANMRPTIDQVARDIGEFMRTKNINKENLNSSVTRSPHNNRNERGTKRRGTKAHRFVF